jgi:hypothetical protein
VILEVREFPVDTLGLASIIKSTGEDRKEIASLRLRVNRSWILESFIAARRVDALSHNQSWVGPNLNRFGFFVSWEGAGIAQLARAQL